MLNTILFDLDGTLLPLDMDGFIKCYFKELADKFKDLFTLEELTNSIMTATNYMVKNTDATKTNQEAFFEYFFNKINHKPEGITPLFEDFYLNYFCKVKKTTRKEDNMIKAVKLLKEKGYNLVVATNPIFPEIAIHQRIQWGGFDVDDFQFITTFEKMHFCKPNSEYYQEILTAINKKPYECMMVGNDVEEDMVAVELGIKAFLIEDCLIHRGSSLDKIDYRGDYKVFYRFVEELPSLI